MTLHRSDQDSLFANRWRLWVDQCGGFLVLVGNQHRVGSGPSTKWTDVSVIADLPRTAGVIERSGSDYSWQPTDSQPSTAAHPLKQWIGNEQSIELSSFAKMKLHVPSPLCGSAVLSLASPHRFGEHVDRVILVDELFLIGSAPDCHVRVRQDHPTSTMMFDDGVWLTRQSSNHPWNRVTMTQSFSIGDLTMMMECGE